MKPGVGPCPGCGRHVQRTKSRVFNAYRGAGTLIHFCPKATTMTEAAPPAQPSFWDEFSPDSNDFQRVPEGERGAGSPLILAPDGSGSVRQYRRATSYISAVEDDFGIGMWKRHLTVEGAFAHDFDRVSWESGDWKTRSKLCDDAFIAAGGLEKADRGTARHSHTDLLDQNQPLPDTLTQTDHDDLTAYQNAVSPLTLVDVELKLVHDGLGVAGTADRVWRYRGVDYVGDLKGLAETTPIPTPSGWTTMAALQVGDEVFGADGRPCTVTAKSQTKRIGTHVVLFDDGSEVVCDTEHIWWTAMPGEETPSARSIGEVIDTLRSPRKQAQHLVPVAGQLDLPEADDLPIDPYLLGCWLGDGHKRDGVITKTDDLFDVLESDGHALGIRQKQPEGKEHIATRTVTGLRTALRKAGLIGVKQIPDAYLRASQHQRLRLLQGLFDTDGSWNIARETAVFSSIDKALASQVRELVLTLGQRANLAEAHGHGFGRDVTSYVVAFTPVGINPFRMPRKADRAAASVKPTTRAKRRVIIAVRPGPDVPTACIAVDSPTSTYLCGESMIPTHNTGKIDGRKCAMQTALYSRSSRYDLRTGERSPLNVDQDRALIVHLPYGEGVARLLWVDIAVGWAGVEECERVYAWRKQRDLCKPFAHFDPLADLIDRAPSAQALGDLWKQWRSEWDETHTARAAARKTALLDEVAS